MSWFLREDVLTWLAALFLAASTMLSARAYLRRPELDEQGVGPGRPPRWLAGIGGYLLLLALAARGLQARGWPLSSTYEVVLWTAAATVLYDALGLPRRLSRAGGLCAGLSATLLIVLTSLLTPAGVRTPQPPPAVLAGPWFPLHILATVLGYGGLLLCGCATLLRPALPARASLGELEELAWRGLAWGYPWLTLGMVTGAIWGWLTWGLYWNWSAKEILTLLTWGLFTAALHTRRLPGWRGWPHSAVLVAGLVALLLTLLAAGVLVRQAAPATLYIF